MSLHIEQGTKYLGDDYWDWWLWLNGTDQELDAVDHVVYRLHSTFPNPVRKVNDRAAKFRMKTAGWGEFVVRVAIVRKDGSRETTEHELVLKYPDGKRTTA